MKPDRALHPVVTARIGPQTKIDYLHRILGYYTDPDNYSHRLEATIIASMIEDYCERVRVARGEGPR